MNRICWWLVDRLSRRLEPGNRDAVLGDIAESGETAGEALRDLLSLAVRSQIELWSAARTWLAPAGMIAPVAMLAGGWSSSGGRGNWLSWVIGQIHTVLTQGVLGESGMRPADGVMRLTCGVLLIAGWAGITGFVLGSVLRRSAWAYAALVCALWWLWIVVPVGVPLRVLFQVPFRQALFWLTAQILLILMPFLWGVRRGKRLGSLEVGRMALLAAAIAGLTLIMQVEDSRQTLAYELWRNGESLGGQLVWTPHVLPFLGVVWEFGILAVARQAAAKEMEI